MSGEKQDSSKVYEKVSELGNKLSTGLRVINEVVDTRLSALESTILSKSSNEPLVKRVEELQESIGNQKVALDYIKATLRNNLSNATEVLTVLEKLSNSPLDKQITSAFTILNSKIDSQTSNIDRLINSTSKEDLANTLSTLDEKLTNIQDNQSTDVINVLEKIDSLERQALINIEVNSKLLEKNQSLENYLLTLVKAVTGLYEKNNELKIMQKHTFDKIEALTETINSLIEPQNEAQASIENTQLQQIEDVKEIKEVKPNMLHKLKNLLKSFPIPKWRTS